MQTWVQASQIIVNSVQAVGIVVGGIWVYFKFFRSRTYARRAELDVKVELKRVEKHHVVKAQVLFKNVGQSKLSLTPDKQFAFLQATKIAGWTPGLNFDWDDMIVTPIFTPQDFVEAQEAIQDEVLLPVDESGGPWLGFRVQALVVTAPPWYRRKGSVWVTNAVVSA